MKSEPEGIIANLMRNSECASVLSLAIGSLFMVRPSPAACAAHHDEPLTNTMVRA